MFVNLDGLIAGHRFCKLCGYPIKGQRQTNRTNHNLAYCSQTCQRTAAKRRQRANGTAPTTRPKRAKCKVCNGEQPKETCAVQCATLGAVAKITNTKQHAATAHAANLNRLKQLEEQLAAVVVERDAALEAAEFAAAVALQTAHDGAVELPAEVVDFLQSLHITGAGGGAGGDA